MKNFYFIVAIFDVLFGSWMLHIGNPGGWFLLLAALCLSVSLALKDSNDLKTEEKDDIL